MRRKPVPILNRIAFTGLAVSAACMAYAGFDYMFANETLSALVGATVGGGVLGRGFRRDTAAPG
jgi:hypothetical protein